MNNFSCYKNYFDFTNDEGILKLSDSIINTAIPTILSDCATELEQASMLISLQQYLHSRVNHEKSDDDNIIAVKFSKLGDLLVDSILSTGEYAENFFRSMDAVLVDMIVTLISAGIQKGSIDKDEVQKGYDLAQKQEEIRQTEVNLAKSIIDFGLTHDWESKRIIDACDYFELDNAAFLAAMSDDEDN